MEMKQEFMNLVAEQCQKEKHHAEWTNVKRFPPPFPLKPYSTSQTRAKTNIPAQVYRNVTIRWTTHVPRGLSMKDIRMAEFCDSAECAVQNSPAELKRLCTRGEVTEGEYEMLLGLRNGESGAADVPEIGRVSAGGAGIDEASTGNGKESPEGQREGDRREAFKKRAERIKRHFVPAEKV